MKTFSTVHRQRGVTLIELMVGLAIGLMVVASAMAALMVSRSISGTVSDASAIQQQASYALRVIGGQLRQAGSLYLNPDPNGGASTDPLSTVVFETDAAATDSKYLSFKQSETISSAATTSELAITFRRYKDAVYPDGTLTALARNCIGGPADNSGDEAIKSVFNLNSEKNELYCNGKENSIVQNVAQFEVLYMQQYFVAGGTVVKYLTATEVTEWGSVQGVQVCLVLYGNEPIDMPADSKYTDCTNTDVKMASLTGQRKNRMHIAFRNTFQLRSQGLL